MIVDYDVVINDQIEKLAGAVKEKIKSNWQPLGGVTQSIKAVNVEQLVGAKLSRVVGVQYAQAMVKDEPTLAEIIDRK